ncbi:MAG: two-component system response regulator [Candidatus Glassbacteria bacterium RIFCSPLOWO2_12_FULL_58_11]|uniref:Two-component system response regulator n=1 Tax=Candidatus Glassbacteria bacterium RIFCSPLOWO2_12_FULL_58_11 TaxID=1817867 RepID=A0A1F5Z370_9BACT|nr:MAG: two-component system response regulator [Candidatus Glassbacteria bacterium RIFCSPLOWO2_12_FULL_58_11]
MKRLLIVDDEGDLRLLYQTEFETEGYRVDTAADAMEALSMFERERYDLIILDIKMPGMDGVEALGKFLGRDNKIPVIINSAFDSYKDNFMSWAADSYVIKSADLSELKQKVKEALGESIYEF